MGGTTTSYTYAGDDVRVRKVQGSTTTNYLWDRASGLPLLVDDGTQGYVHAGGAAEQVDGAGAGTYPLTDALGSVRAHTDGSGAVTATADYDVFGAVRASTGTAGTFGFTGEQTDPETGFVFLRSRYYAPSAGRFLARDSVQPNAPGTQGFNPYAYVANNPTTWTDPSGHLVDDGTVRVLLGGQVVVEVARGLSQRAFLGLVFEGCALNGWCAGVLFSLEGVTAAGIIVLALLAVWCVAHEDCIAFLPDWGDAGPRPVSTAPPPGTAPAPAPTPPPGPIPVPVPPVPQPGPDCGHNPPHLPGFCPPPPPPTQLPDPCGPGSLDYPRHHIFPQKPDLKRQFVRRGIDIDRYTMKLPKRVHDDLTYGRTPYDPRPWNTIWDNFFANNPNATREQIMDRAKKMIDQFRLQDYPLCPYDGNGGPVELIYRYIPARETVWAA